MNEPELKMLREVHQAVVGNKELGHEGLVKGFQRHDEWIRRADVRIATFFGGFTVIVFLLEYVFRK